MSKSQTDIFTGFDVTIGSDHAYIHEGKGYVLVGDTGSINASAVWHISFKTPGLPGGKYIHLRPARLSSSANALAISITENAVMTSGTAATPQNLRRNIKKPSTVVIYTGATLSTAGDALIFQDAVGSGGASNRSGGDSASGEERVLKPDTMYDIAFTNIGAVTATTGYYTLFWYEE